MKYLNSSQRELHEIMTEFLKPRSYYQKQVLAKIFALRWAVASGIDMQNAFDDPENIKWCKS